MTTKEPTAVMIERLNNRNILSKTAADKYGNDVDQHPTGTGPYKFVSWQRDGNLFSLATMITGDQRRRSKKS